MLATAALYPRLASATTVQDGLVGRATDWGTRRAASQDAKLLGLSRPQTCTPAPSDSGNEFFMRPVFLLGFVLGLVIVASFGCTGDDGVAHGAGTDSPRGVAQQFIECAESQDRDGFLKLLTQPARKALDGGAGFDLSAADLELISVGEEEVQGEEATVSLRVKQEGEERDCDLSLRWEGRAWRVYAVTMTGAGQTMTVNFEEFGNLMQAMADSIGAEMQSAWQEAQAKQEQRLKDQRREFYESLRAMTQEDFEATWSNPVDFRGKTTREALAALAQQVDLEVEWENHDGFDRPVDRDVQGMSALAAIAQLCDQIGLYPVFPNLQQAGWGQDLSNSLSFGKGEPPFPVSYVGPFRVTVSDLEQTVPYGRGKATVLIQGRALDPAVTGLCDDLGETTVFERVDNAAGESLMNRSDVRYIGGGIREGRAYQNEIGVDLKQLLRSVEHIAVLEGLQKLPLPREVVEVTMEPLRAGEVERVGKLALEVQSVGTSTAIKITGPGEQVEQLMACCRCWDANGKELEVMYDDVSSWSAGKAQLQFQSEQSPAKLSIKLVVAREVLDFPFALHEIPLSEHLQMPEAIGSIAFEGYEQPISVRSRGFRESDQFPLALLEIDNHSNKDVLSLQVEFHYLDGRGKVLKEFPHSITGSMSMSGPESLVEQGASLEHEATAFFRPEKTQGLQVILREVEFMDGSRWKAP